MVFTLLKAAASTSRAGFNSILSILGQTLPGQRGSFSSVDLDKLIKVYHSRLQERSRAGHLLERLARASKFRVYLHF